MCLPISNIDTGPPLSSSLATPNVSPPPVYQEITETIARNKGSILLMSNQESRENTSFTSSSHTHIERRLYDLRPVAISDTANQWANATGSVSEQIGTFV